MNELLSKALANVPLQPGRTYYATVGGKAIELVVSEGNETAEFENMFMLDLVLNIPDPPGGLVFKPEVMADVFPDPILIPEDWEAK